MSRAERNKEKQNSNKGEVTVLGRVMGAVGMLIMIMAIIVCLALAAPRLAGMDSYIVVSGSMEPAIPVGSLVYSKPCEPDTLESGQVIVFYDDGDAEMPVTHRVVENHPEDGELITKGDANEGNDLRPVMYQNVVGRVVAHIPKLGVIVAPLSSLAGKAAVAMVILAGYLLAEAGSRIRKKA